jgi:tetratricopeptide (TPR) repeat protein
MALIVASVGFYTGTTLEALAWAGLLTLSIAGIARWHWHRRRSRALVVARFSTVREQEGMAERVQELVMTSLQDKLPPTLLPLVHDVPAVIGTADRGYAIQLRRRLRSLYLVHGRVEQRPDGGWAVFARVVQPAERAVKHADWNTRDVTPARARWGALFELLTPSKEVIADEYPLEFANELEAIIRGIAGQVAAFFEDDERAEEFLKAALAKAPISRSHQVDQLRVALARVFVRTERRQEALDLLRERARGEDPSPALLRELHALLGPQVGTIGTVSDQDATEAISALRRAAKYDTDPQRDMTVYNLAIMLCHHGGDSGREEADRLLAELMRTSSFYRGAWYTSFHRGATHYEMAIKASENDDDKAARLHFKRAARLYSRGLRARPRIRFFWRDGPRIWVLKRFDRSPIMYANAKDAHEGAAHPLRARWYELRFQRLRWRMLKTAEKHFDARNWDGAYAYFDWPIVGRWDDIEVVARVQRAIVSRQRGDDEQAEAYWAETVERAPEALVVRSAIVDKTNPPLERGVPGPEPTNF